MSLLGVMRARPTGGLASPRRISGSYDGAGMEGLWRAVHVRSFLMQMLHFVQHDNVGVQRDNMGVQHDRVDMASGFPLTTGRNDVRRWITRSFLLRTAMKSGGGSPFHLPALDVVAERVGFEPTVPLPAHVLSRHADSAALAPLRVGSSATFGDVILP